MTKLGDTILEGLHQIKQMRDGEEIGAKVHKMTNDKQIDEVARAINNVLNTTDWYNHSEEGLENRKEMRAAAKAAIAATHEQYKPLLEALEFYADFEENTDNRGVYEYYEEGDPLGMMTLDEGEIAKQALANLPEELRG